MPANTLDRFPAFVERNGRSISDTPERAERRKRARMEVHWPLSFPPSATADPIETVTHNLSSDGFYCLATVSFVPGEVRDCTLSIPTHHPHSGIRVLPVDCRVKVIRVEALGNGGLYGVGCRIEDYHFVDDGNRG